MKHLNSYSNKLIINFYSSFGCRKFIIKVVRTTGELLFTGSTVLKTCWNIWNFKQFVFFSHVQLQASKSLGLSTKMFESIVLHFCVPRNNHSFYCKSGEQVFLFFFSLFFFMMNLEDLFPLPALTHCDLSTVSSPLKRKRKRRKNPASIKAHSLALDVKQTCKSVIHMQAGWTLFRGFFFFSWEIHSGTHVWNPYLPSQETCLFVSFLDGVWWCL